MALMICQIETLMLVLMSIVHLVNSQGTVSIPTTNLSPQLDDAGFMLQCNIDNFQPALNRALAWTQDGDLVSWNRDIHGKFNGQTREIVIGITTYYYLDITQVEASHGGTYKCLIADGQPTSYTEVASAEVMVQVPYFPPEPYPICSPSVSTIAVVGTDVTLSCTSLPGYPDEVTLVLQRGGQSLTAAGGTVSGNMKQLETSYTIISADSGMSFACKMMGTGIYSTMSRTCSIGPLEVVAGLPRILPTMLTKSEGQNAIFTCELSFLGTINWYTEPPTQSSRSAPNGMTFTLLNVQLSDNDKIVVCMATIGGAVVEDRAHLTVNPFVPPPTMAPTTKPSTTMKVIDPVIPVLTNQPIIIMSTTKQTTDKRPDPGNSQPTDIVTNLMDTTEDSPITSLTTGVPDQIILIAIGAVGGLVFILIIVIVAACVCCYSRRPKPIIMTDGNQSDSGDSWDADGAMTRRSRIRVVDTSSNPPPRLPASTNYGYEDAHTHANNLLKIPDDGLSTVRTSSTMSPSLAYAMDYLSQPEDPMRDDDMSSTAFTMDSRAYGGGMGQFDDHDVYSRGQTSFGDEYPRTPGTQGQGQAYEEDSGTFIRHPGPVYDSVAKDQDPDMPTYAVPHRDRSSKQSKQGDNNDERQISSYDNDQNAPDLTRHRTSSIPYVNTAFPRNSGGFVENSIYQSAEQNMQYF